MSGRPYLHRRQCWSRSHGKKPGRKARAFSELAGTTRLLVLQPTPFCNILVQIAPLFQARADRHCMSFDIVEAAVRFVFDRGLAASDIAVVWHAGEPLVLPPAWYREAFARIARVAGEPRAGQFRPGAEWECVGRWTGAPISRQTHQPLATSRWPCHVGAWYRYILLLGAPRGEARRPLSSGQPAVVPLLIDEPATQAILDVYDDDPALAVWWATEVECVSALSRRERDGLLTRRRGGRTDPA